METPVAKYLNSAKLNVFHPYSTWRLRWDFSIVVVMTYILVNIPLQICFQINLPPDHPWSFVDLGVNVFFMIDILVNFNTAFFQQSKLITSRREIAKNYTKDWFWLDLITSVPFDQILTNAKSITQLAKIFKIARIIRLVKLFRILKMKNTMTKWEQNDDFALAPVRLVQFAALIFLVGHYAACIWVGVTNYYRSSDQSYENFRGYNQASWIVRFDSWDQSLFIIYFRALYFAFTTLTTVGYGDITPLLPLEIGVTIVLQMCGTSLFGFIIGNVASLMTAEDENILILKEKRATVQNVIRSRELPEEIASKIRRHYEYAWKQKYIDKEEEIFEELPISIRTECALFIHRKIIQKVPMFRSLNKEVLPSLVTRLKPQLAAIHDVIVKEGLFGNELTFICKGEVILTFGYNPGHDDQPEQQIKIETRQAGDHFGDYAVILDQARHPATVTAVSYCDLYILHRHDFLQFGDEFPLALLQILDACKERFIQLTKKISEERHRLILEVNLALWFQGERTFSTAQDECDRENQDDKTMKSMQSPRPQAEQQFEQTMLKMEEKKDENCDDLQPKCAPDGITGSAIKLLRTVSSRFLLKKKKVEDSDDETENFVQEIVEVKINPVILQKILAWKSRAQLKITLNNLEVVRKRHHERFGIHSNAQPSRKMLTETKNSGKTSKQPSKDNQLLEPEMFQGSIQTDLQQLKEFLKTEINSSEMRLQRSIDALEERFHNMMKEHTQQMSCLLAKNSTLTLQNRTSI